MEDEFIARAKANLPALLGQPDFRLNETLKPMYLSAMALGGTVPVFWGSSLREVRSISVPESHADRGLIALHSKPGALIVSLSGVNGYTFYIEADIRTPTPKTLMHWDATFADNPVSGVMTRPAPGGDLHYFATPSSTRPDSSHFQISQQDMAGTPDEHWTLLEVRMLGFMH